MGLIPETTIHEIRERVDLVGLIGRHVDLKQAGRNWKGLCPFHDEKTPSFNVNPDRRIFHCFGCGEGGNVFAFLQKRENLTFPEAVRTLAAELGIEVPETDRVERSESERIYAALQIAQDCYRSQLSSPGGKAAREYLEARGLDAEIIDRFDIGYAPNSWDTVLRALEKARIPAEIAFSAGLLCERSKGGHYDRLRGRIIFPIRDVRGRVIAFGGRALAADQEPKYLNTPESPIYQKRRGFYGFPAALEAIRRAGRAIVCEGYFDVVALARAGVGEAVATCGTALSQDHARDLRRRTRTVGLLFDGDAAGRKAMERALEILLPAELRIRAIDLPEGLDPDDYLRIHGAEALRTLIDAAPDALEVVIHRSVAAGSSTPAEKADAVRRVAPLMAVIADPVERNEYIRRLAMSVETDPAAVESLVRDSKRDRPPRAEAEAKAQPSRPRPVHSEDRHLRHIALIFSRHPDLTTEELRRTMGEVLPESPWKKLIFALLDAAAGGCLDAEGAVDATAMANVLSPELLPFFHEVVVDESLLSGDTPASEVLVQLLARYLAKDIEAREKNLKRRMMDPDEDPVRLLEERQALLERRRSKTDFGLGLNP